MFKSVTAVTAVLAAVLIPEFAAAQVPAISAGGIVNAASFAPGQALSAGSLVAIFGTQLAAQLAQADSVPLSVSLANVSVAFNGVLAPLDFVSPGQINAQIPYEVLPPGASGTVAVQVANNGALSAPEAINIVQFNPGVFAIGNYAVAINATNPTDPRYATLAAPSGSIQGLTTFPAQPNDILLVYATGLGPVNPPVVSGHDSLDGLRNTDTIPTVLINNAQASVLFSGLTPNYPGVYQLNIGVPPTIGAGNALPLQIVIGGVASPATAPVIAVSAQ